MISSSSAFLTAPLTLAKASSVLIRGCTAGATASASGVTALGSVGVTGAGACFCPNGMLAAPLITPPPIPPLSPALINRSKLSGVKKFLFSSTNFSAAGASRSSH
jgi:hypothetical protein